MIEPTEISPDSNTTLIIGLGNSLLTDDGIGPLIAQQLKAQTSHRTDVVCEEDAHGGLRLMERLIGYDSAIIIDAICTGSTPGSIFELSIHDLPTYHSTSAHDLSLPMALALGRAAGAKLPTDHNIRLFGIEAADVLTFCETCTTEIMQAAPVVIQRVLTLLQTTPPLWPPPLGKIDRNSISNTI
jgi:hydrogenase maturation protease